MPTCPLPSNGEPSAPAEIHWVEAGQPRSARWRSERGTPAPTRVELVDDRTPADNAYRMACEGIGLLWRGDFHNARALLQAMGRRAERSIARGHPDIPIAMPLAFHQYRQAQSQRARVLGMLLMGLDASYRIALRRAPNCAPACLEAWGPGQPIALTESATETADACDSVVSLRELLGIRSAHEWRRVGIEISALGSAPNNRIYPHYGVFSPQRSEYVALVATAHLPKPPKGQSAMLAFDIGTGSGVLSAVLARRGVAHIVATDSETRALVCAADNLARLGLTERVTLLQADLFPPGRASLIVCNPPWLPGSPGSSLERAVYDEDARMLKSFLAGLCEHLEPRGEGWLIMSNLAEHLGLRHANELTDRFTQAGLRVVSRIDARPLHPKAHDPADVLHQARRQEVTSLWRLTPQRLQASAQTDKLARHI